jgi:uncharacterized protein
MEREFNPSSEEIAIGCKGTLPPLAVSGLELFNQGEYFEAHEALELAWREETGPVRELYRGILQIAVAYYHILRGNYPGAVKMFQRSRTWLNPFPDRCQGVDLAQFRQDYTRVEDALHRLGPDRLRLFDRALMKPIQYHVRSDG